MSQVQAIQRGVNMREIGKGGLQDRVIRRARARGWFAEKVTWPGRNGGPDVLCVRGGRHIFIETKGTEKDARELQHEFHADLRKHGAEVYVIKTMVEAELILS